MFFKRKWFGIGGESGSGKSILVKLLMCYWDLKGWIKLNDNVFFEIIEFLFYWLEGVME